jgi:acyl carrier protein
MNPHRIDDIIREELGADFKFTRTTTLSSISSSSIARTLMCMKLEDELGIEQISDTEMNSLQTVEDIHKLVQVKSRIRPIAA